MPFHVAHNNSLGFSSGEYVGRGADGFISTSGELGDRGVKSTAGQRTLSESYVFLKQQLTA